MFNSILSLNESILTKTPLNFVLTHDITPHHFDVYINPNPKIFFSGIRGLSDKNGNLYVCLSTDRSGDYNMIHYDIAKMVNLSLNETVFLETYSIWDFYDTFTSNYIGAVSWIEYKGDMILGESQPQIRNNIYNEYEKRLKQMNPNVSFLNGYM